MEYMQGEDMLDDELNENGIDALDKYRGIQNYAEWAIDMMNDLQNDAE